MDCLPPGCYRKSIIDARTGHLSPSQVRNHVEGEHKTVYKDVMYVILLLF